MLGFIQKNEDFANDFKNFLIGSCNEINFNVFNYLGNVQVILQIEIESDRNWDDIRICTFNDVIFHNNITGDIDIYYNEKEMKYYAIIDD